LAIPQCSTDDIVAHSLSFVNGFWKNIFRKMQKKFEGGLFGIHKKFTANPLA